MFNILLKIIIDIFLFQRNSLFSKHFMIVNKIARMIIFLTQFLYKTLPFCAFYIYVLCISITLKTTVQLKD